MKDFLKRFLMMAPDAGAGTGGDGGAGNGAGAAGEGTQHGDGQSTPSFDEMLRNPAYQAEFDRRVQKALATSGAKSDEQMRRAVADAIEEGKRQAGLSVEEQLAEMRKSLEKEREQLRAQTLKNQARTLAMDNGLDAEAADWLRYASEDEAKASVLALKAYIDKAASAKAEATIRERMAGHTPGGSGSGQGEGKKNGVYERFYALHPELKTN